MKRWFTLKQEVSADGLYNLLRLETIDGRASDTIPEFVTQLVEHIWGYAVKENIDLTGRFNAYYAKPSTDAWTPGDALERLLAVHDGVYKPLMGYVGECLAHWLFQTFDPPLLMSEPKIFSADPAWDLIKIMDLVGPPDSFRLGCVQAKVTSGYARARCQEAVDNYKKLHDGIYDTELVNELSMFVRNESIRPHLIDRDWRRILIDPSQREYSIFVAYDGAAPDIFNAAWARGWQNHINTSEHNRILITLPLSDCPTLISDLVSKIRAKSI